MKYTPPKPEKTNKAAVKPTNNVTVSKVLPTKVTVNSSADNIELPSFSDDDEEDAEEEEGEGVVMDMDVKIKTQLKDKIKKVIFVVLLSFLCLIIVRCN